MQPGMSDILGIK